MKSYIKVLLVLFLVLGLANASHGEFLRWTGYTGDGFLRTPGNWVKVGEDGPWTEPIHDDVLQIYSSAEDVLIEQGEQFTVRRVHVGYGDPNEASLVMEPESSITMTGQADRGLLIGLDGGKGTVTVGADSVINTTGSIQALVVGMDPGSVGNLVIDGSVSVNGSAYIARAGSTGTVTVGYDGQLSVSESAHIAHQANSFATVNVYGTVLVGATVPSPWGHSEEATVRINLYDGLMQVGSWISGLAGDSIINIEQGILRVGSHHHLIEGYIDNDQITAYGGAGQLFVDYEDGYIVVTAEPGPAYASNPFPAHLSTAVPYNVTLSWDPGSEAISYDVYFGEDYNEVRNATDPDQLPGRGNQAGRTYGPLDLEWDTTYYWRVDAVNPANPDSPWKGPIWSFTTEPYLIVDDMETYDSASQMRDSWISGGGGWVNLEESIVYEASQSMLFSYFQNSTATLTFGVAQDWTARELSVLELFVRGSEGNTGGPLTITIEDENSVSTTIEHPDFEGLSPDVEYGIVWQPWRIPLDQLGGSIDVTAVKSIQIAVAEGSGTLYFDDIKVRESGCFEGMYPAGDFNQDCIVDWYDLQILAADWLLDSTGDQEPAQENLLVWYKFDETSGSTAYDSSGNDYHGSIEWAYYPEWGNWSSDGKIGGCLVFNANYVVSVPGQAFENIDEQITVMLWVNGNPDVQPAADSVLGADDGVHIHHSQFNVSLPWINGAVYFSTGALAQGDWDRIVWQDAPPSAWAGQWNHYAFVKDLSVGEKRMYLNGELVASGDGFSRPFDIQRFAIGGSANTQSSLYSGKVDDFRVYDYALTQQEILAVSGGRLSTDLTEDGNINFGDFAKLAVNWLEDILWP